MKKMKMPKNPTLLYIGTWTLNQLKRYNYSGDVPIEEFKNSLRDAAVLLDATHLGQSFAIMLNKTEFFGCCVLTDLINFIITSKQETQNNNRKGSEDEDTIANGIMQGASMSVANFLMSQVKARHNRKTTFTRVELEFIRWYLAVAAQVPAGKHIPPNVISQLKTIAAV